MKRIATYLASAVILLGLAAGNAARAASDEQNLIDQAKITLDDVRKDKEFGNAHELLKRAKAVLIVPALFKGGFFVGGEGGTGVLMSRSSGTSWSYPVFYTMASASFGLQIGAQQSELVLIALTDKARNAFLQDEFKIGAEAGLAVVTLGSSAEGAVTSNAGADIVVWSSSTGAYAGLTLNGSIIKPRSSYNEAYYGHPISSADILNHNSGKNAGAEPLRATLAHLSGV